MEMLVWDHVHLIEKFVMTKARSGKCSYRIRFVFKEFLTDIVHMQTVHIRKLQGEKFVLQMVLNEEFVCRCSYRIKFVLYKVCNPVKFVKEKFASDNARIQEVRSG